VKHQPLSGWRPQRESGRSLGDVHFSTWAVSPCRRTTRRYGKDPKFLRRRTALQSGQPGSCYGTLPPPTRSSSDNAPSGAKPMTAAIEFTRAQWETRSEPAAALATGEAVRGVLAPRRPAVGGLASRVGQRETARALSNGAPLASPPMRRSRHGAVPVGLRITSEWALRAEQAFPSAGRNRDKKSPSLTPCCSPKEYDAARGS
jgi:hypothetical protein